MIGVTGSVGGKNIEATNAITLLNDGIDLIRSYELISGQTKRIELIKVKYFLLSRSIELLLKSLIKFSTGESIEKIKKHNLMFLYPKVSKILKLQSAEIEIIKNLDEYYPEGKKEFEYTKVRNDSMILPTLNDVYNLVIKIKDNVRRYKDSNKVKYL